MQADFLREMIGEAEKNGLSMAIETCGYGSWENIFELFPHFQVVLYDLKFMDEEKHREYTGVSNKIILENLERIALELNVPLWIRMPLIAGVNDSFEEMEARVRFLSQFPKRIEKIYLLPFHDLGVSKLNSLDYSDEKMKSFQTPSMEHLNACREILTSAGFEVLIG